jgi:membrane protein implicated in regulation of membrane protease activity
MGIGGGITLIVIGLIFLTGVIQFDIPGVGEQALGVILVLGGIAAIVLAQTMWRDRGLTTERPVSEPRGTTGRVVEREVIETEVPPERL